MDKTALREKFRSQIKLLSREQRENESNKIVEKLTHFFSGLKGFWSLFYPMADEPNLLNLIKTSGHIQWLFPKTDASGQLRFARVDDPSAMPTNAWGLREPSEDCDHVSLNKISGFVIPALAYDTYGVRLGRGGGFYDKTLAGHPGQKVGVCYSCSFSQNPLPRENHDKVMDVVVHPEKFLIVSEVTNDHN